MNQLKTKQYNSCGLDEETIGFISIRSTFGLKHKSPLVYL